MRTPARLFVAGVLLFFAWKDSALSIQWPPTELEGAESPRPPTELLVLAEDLRPIVSTMLPSDRQHLSAFYDAMAYILLKDRERADPIVSNTEKFAAFHAGSLQLAIEKKKVGVYPGLAKAIDSVFVKAVGPEVAEITSDKSTRLVAACGVLSWVLGVHHE